MRLIDADTLRKDVEKDRDASDMPKMWYQGIEYAINHIIHAPTVDAVEVVRCKDCVHKPRGTRNKHDMEFPDEICPCQCDDYWYSWMPYDDWFCANGERREDETY